MGKAEELLERNSTQYLFSVIPLIGIITFLSLLLLTGYSMPLPEEKVGTLIESILFGGFVISTILFVIATWIRVLYRDGLTEGAKAAWVMTILFGYVTSGIFIMTMLTGEAPY